MKRTDAQERLEYLTRHKKSRGNLFGVHILQGSQGYAKLILLLQYDGHWSDEITFSAMCLDDLITQLQQAKEFISEAYDDTGSGWRIKGYQAENTLTILED